MSFRAVSGWLASRRFLVCWHYVPFNLLQHLFTVRVSCACEELAQTCTALYSIQHTHKPIYVNTLILWFILNNCFLNYFSQNNYEMVTIYESLSLTLSIFLWRQPISVYLLFLLKFPCPLVYVRFCHNIVVHNFTEVTLTTTITDWNQVIYSSAQR